MNRQLATALLPLILLVGCDSDPTGVTPPPDDDEEELEVAEFFAALPSWTQFAPLEPESDPAPVAGAEQTVSRVFAPDPSNPSGDPIEYSCFSTDYSLAKTPEQIVMYDPAAVTLWPGALIQGKGHRDPIGTLRGLTVAQRAPVDITIPVLPGGDNVRSVVPSLSTVSQAISEMVGNATVADLASARSINFQQETAHSARQFALSVGISAKYLGFRASASGAFDRRAEETTVAVNFLERMFTVVVAPPQTPEAFFAPEFNGDALQAQIDQGNIGPDNVPLYVSSVVYGRMMVYSFTSTESEQRIKSALNASFEAFGAGGSIKLSVQDSTTLANARITLQTVGGSAEGALRAIRTGDIAQFFDTGAPLSSAFPLSYEFRELGHGNDIARVTESTQYTLRECVPITGDEVFAFAEEITWAAPAGMSPQPHRTFVADVNGDGHDDVIWNDASGSTNGVYVGLGEDANSGLRIQSPAFHPGPAPVEGWGVYTTHVGDMNGDGLVDLVWNHLKSTQVSTRVYVALADGAGGWQFLPPQDVTTNHSTIFYYATWDLFHPIVGDFDGNGTDDIAWSAAYGSGTRYNFIRFAYADSTGHLGSGKEISTFGSGWSEWSMARAANVDGQTGEDLVWYHLPGDQVIVGRADPAGLTFHRVNMQPYAGRPGWRPTAWFLADVDNDAFDDLIWFRDPLAGQKTAIHVGRGTAAATFVAAGTQQDTTQARVSMGTDTGPFHVLVGDFNGDAHADILWNRLESRLNRMFVGLGTPAGHFDFSPAVQNHFDEAANWALYSAYVGDFDNDGADDVLWWRPPAKAYIGWGVVD